MKLSVCATLISLSLLVGCQSTPSTDNSSLSENSSNPSSDIAKSTNHDAADSVDIICPQLGIQPVTVAVSDLWADGEVVTDAYTGRIAQVKNGSVTLTPSRHSGGLLLLESKKRRSPFSVEECHFLPHRNG